MSLDPSSGKALLLNNSTEVSIAPKLRAKSKSAKAGADTASAQKPVSLANGSSSQGTSTAEKPKTTRSARTLRLLPQRFLRECALPTSTGNEESIAFVSFKSLLSLYPQAAPPPQLKAWRATVRRLLPPANPDKEATPASPVSQPAPRVLIPNGDASTSKATPTIVSKNAVTVVWSPDVPVPDGHVAMQPVCDNAEDWDLVR